MKLKDEAKEIVLLFIVAIMQIAPYGKSQRTLRFHLIRIHLLRAKVQNNKVQGMCRKNGTVEDFSGHVNCMVVYLM